MSHSGLKKKYLQRAHNLIWKSGHNQKLQASVEPFIHQSPHQSQLQTAGQKCAPILERSNSDPAFTGSPPTPGTLQDGDQKVERMDSCSDSDSMSLYSFRSLPISDLHRLEGTTTVPQQKETLAREQVGSLYVSPNSSPVVQKSPLSPHFYPFSSTPAANTGTYGCHYANYSASDQGVSSGMKSATEEGKLSAQLKVQMEVNRELKRLLVASIGGDIQLRLDQIVQEKAELSRNLDTSLQQLAENNEDLDRLSIECDIWRSKFLASRLMIDELASWKAELSMQFKDSQRALHCLMKERNKLCRELYECNSYLQRTVESLQQLVTQRSDTGMHGEGGSIAQQGSGYSGRVATVLPVQYPKKAPLQSQHSTSPASGVHQLTVLEMAYTLRSMTKTLNQLLCTEGVIVTPPQEPGLMESAGPGGRGTDNYQQHSLYHHVTQPTVGEKLARQVLRSREQYFERSLPLPLRLSDEELITSRMENRTISPLTQCALDDDLSLFYCKKCKGKVFNV